MSDLLWIAVPGGIVDGEGLLRVLIVPRLDPGTVGGNGLAVWPPPSLAEGRGITVELSIDAEHQGGFNTFAVEPEKVSLAVQPGLWERFFPPDMVVAAPRARGAAAPEVAVHATSLEADAVRATFDGVAGTPVSGEDPAVPPALDAAAREQLATHWNGNPPSFEPVPPLPPPLRRPDPPDFNRTISLLREHPAVLRALGLILELMIPPPPPSEFRVRVSWSGPEAVPTVVSPGTLLEEGFRPLSTGDLSAGMVTLTDDRPGGDGATPWDVVTMDVDGAAGRLRDAAAATAGPEPVTLPALTSAGLLLLRRRREESFASRLGRAGSRAEQPLESADLVAEDLVLGYRIDVRRGGGDWRSLHERLATYELGDEAIGERGLREEGHLKAHPAVSDGNGSLTADDVVARWDGWSLAVARRLPEALTGRRPTLRRAEAPFDFRFAFAVPPGSLPELRFKAQYRLRARVADMAGGGLALDDPAADRCMTEQVRYRRYQPVASPGLLLPDGVAAVDLGPAEAVDRVVLRSDPAAGAGVEQFAAANPRYAAHLGRALLPPTAPLAIAEQHGMLDGVSDERTFEWARRAAAGALDDPAAGGVTAFTRPERGGVVARMVDRSWEPWPDRTPKSLALSGAAPGASAVAWEGEVLAVRLAPAAQITLELSSNLTEDFLDQFALHDPAPDESRAAADAGRHPLITPAAPLTLVHAVRRPLGAHDGELEAVRVPGQTSAGLVPSPPMLGVDDASTGQLRLTASWTEHRDDQTEDVTDAHVQTVVVDRGDEAFKEPLVHAFPDTKHRMVTYSLAAVGRFRQFFAADEEEDAFIARRQLPAEVTILSSARPVPPVVLSTRPAFRWAEERGSDGGFETIQRVRRGGGLRVELARPWFTTGQDELLAVLARPDDGDPGEGVRPFLTQLGRDPIFDTPDPPRWPSFAAFAGTSRGPERLVLPEAGAPVFMVPYETWFAGDRWFADVVLPDLANASYCPFAQLAVARYQGQSLPGLELSRAVTTEMVQLFPDRTLTLKRSADQLFVTLAGLGPAGPRPNRVDVVLEHCPRGVADVQLVTLGPGGDGVPAWAPVPGATRQVDLNTPDVQLPLPPGDDALRVRVREVESIGRDDAPPAAQTSTPGELAERTVFTDVVIL